MQSQTFSPVTADVHAAIGRDVAKEMAAFMRANAGCTFDDLRGEGFSSRQIARYAPAARVLADRLSTRRVA